MTNRSNLLLVTPALLLLACGDLKTPQALVGQVRYKTNGDIAAFLPRELVMLDGRARRREAAHPVRRPARRQADVRAESMSADGRDRGSRLGAVDDRGIRRTVVVSRSPAAGSWPRSEGPLRPRISSCRRPAICSRWSRPTRLARDRQGPRLRRGERPRAGADEAITNQFVFSPDGTRLYGTITAATASGPGTLGRGRRCSSSTRPKERTATPLRDPPISPLSPDGQHLVVGMPRGEGGTARRRLRLVPNQRSGVGADRRTRPPATTTCMCSRSRRIASASPARLPVGRAERNAPPRIQMWTASGTLLYVIEASFIGDLDFSADGARSSADAVPVSGRARAVSLYRVSDGGADPPARTFSAASPP